VISIETLLDLKTLTIEELVGRLNMAEDRLSLETIIDKTQKLMLSEEDWEAKNCYRLMSDPSLLAGSEKKWWKPKGGGSGARGDCGGKKEYSPKYTSEGTPRRKGHCRNCGTYGHWKEDCKRPPRKQRKEESHVTQAE